MPEYRTSRNLYNKIMIATGAIVIFYNLLAVSTLKVVNDKFLPLLIKLYPPPFDCQVGFYYAAPFMTSDLYRSIEMR
jgi:hypothetical protein